MDPLLENAVGSIAVGVEDYKNGSRARLVSATRNIYAGILLLFKEHLRRLSPADSNDALIKAVVVPKQIDGKVVFVGEGKITIDFQGIAGRYASLNIDVKESLRQLKKLQSIRNDMEHMFSDETKDAVSAAMHSALLVLVGFAKQHLRMEPRELLGESLWKDLLAIDEIHKKELEEVRVALSQTPWHSEVMKEAVSEQGACDNCGSTLLRPLLVFNQDTGQPQPPKAVECQTCGNQLYLHDYADQWLNDHLGLQRYAAIKDGGSDPLSECFQCERETYLAEEDTCAICGFVKEYADCESCGVPLTSDSHWVEGFCSFCFDGGT